MNKNYRVRPVSLTDAEALTKIYKYYVEETAITYEYDVPSVSEFTERIKNITKKFPYLVAEDISGDAPRIVGYAYASSFHEREAYKWCAEMSIYLDKDERGHGIGKRLYEELEKILQSRGFLNLNSCIAYPDKEDEYLTFNSVEFHKHMGYSMVGEFHKCGYKFGRWYNMVWMEKHIGEHEPVPEDPSFRA
ncbi:MAG: GNAT family N-acetyltransferase [Butyrivibrio sp.]|nr:GNAT family N-acetyltransferase [Butyrivibrio sp.]